jgi:hypothetical protein
VNQGTLAFQLLQFAPDLQPLLLGVLEDLEVLSNPPHPDLLSGQVSLDIRVVLTVLAVQLLRLIQEILLARDLQEAHHFHVALETLEIQAGQLPLQALVILLLQFVLLLGSLVHRGSLEDPLDLVLLSFQVLSFQVDQADLWLLLGLEIQVVHLCQEYQDFLENQRQSFLGHQWLL